MKKIYITFFICLLFYAYSAFSQNINKAVFYTGQLKDGITEKELDFYLQPANKQLPAFSYLPKYPGANNPELLKYYILITLDSIYNPINEPVFQQLFSSISAHEFSILLEDCDHPVTVNDAWHVNNWANHWHLESVNAYCAWSITTGDPSIIVGVADSDFDTSHEDLSGKLAADVLTAPIWERHYHGTEVAGTVAANTNNRLGIASIGYDTKVRCFEVWDTININGTPGRLQSPNRAIWNSYLAGDRIINLSMSDSFLDSSAIVQITQQSLLVFAAGNESTAKHHYKFANIPGVILVTGLDHGNTLRKNHARHDRIDICAPGGNVPVLKPNNSYGSDWGTSFAAPMVAGTAALMLSVNPDLTPALLEKIIKATADPVADGHLYPGLIGAGRLNAYRAVGVAKSFSEKLDLYIRDSKDDVGEEPNINSPCFHESEDIWVRNQDDGIMNQIHQNAEYSPNQPVYVYVRVRNKSMKPSTGEEKLHLHWSKAGPYWDWPGPWEGDMTVNSCLLGGLVATQPLPVILPGEEAIIAFEWHAPNPHEYENVTDIREPWHFCLMARIESAEDPLRVYPGLKGYLQNNNNAAMKNVHVIDGALGSGVISGMIGFLNTFEHRESFRLRFDVPIEEMEQPIIKEAEVTIRLSENFYKAWENDGFQGEGIKNMGDCRLYITKPNAYIDLTLPPKEFYAAAAGFHFLTQQISEKPTFKYYLELQRKGEKEDFETLGGELFIINKWERDLFKADAGNDKLISKGTSADLHARDIFEAASYHWYDVNDSLLYTGKDFTVSPLQTQKYKLEVVSEIDGYKDYDEVTVRVKEFEIKKLSPNPTHSDLTVEYDATGANSAFFYIYNANGILLRMFPLNVGTGSAILNVSGYQTGSYSLTLICNGQIADVKTFIVN